MRRATTATLLASAIAACALASTARADGDPASDYLLTQDVFLPFDTKLPAMQVARFTGLVDATNRAGFRLRVALITSSHDMGSVIALYRKPRAYAYFLGAELSFVYRQRLLVVMPNGFGFNWPGHPSAPAYAALANIRVKPGSRGLLQAARTAVQRLAAAAGIKVAPAPAATVVRRADSNGRLIIIAAAVAALSLAAAVRVALRLGRP